MPVESRPLALVHVPQPDNGGGPNDDNNRLPLIARPDLRIISSNLPGPGRILNKINTSVGRVLEDRANHLGHRQGKGPVGAADRIERAFGDTVKARLAKLELIYRTSRRDYSPSILEIRKDCHRLVEYARP